MDYEVMMNGIVKMGEYAPEFEANTTMGRIKLSDYKGKWIVLFSYSGDFSPVCTTEVLEFANANEVLKKKNTEVIGLSIDSNSSHLAWAYDIFLRTGIKIPFPIIADRSGEISRKYGMISSNIDNSSTLRNVYIIDDKGIIRAILVYPVELRKKYSRNN